MEFKTISSKSLYQGKAVKLWLEEVLYPDDRLASFELVRHSGAVTILPIDEDGKIWFVRQYRHPAGQMLLELPAGTIEPGEPHRETAAREIREEIGMAADQLDYLGGFFMAPGYSTEYMHVYLAQGLTPDPLEQDDSEFIIVEKLPKDEVYQMAESGSIQDGKTLAILLMAQKLLSEHG